MQFLAHQPVLMKCNNYNQYKYRATILTLTHFEKRSLENFNTVNAILFYEVFMSSFRLGYFYSSDKYEHG